MLSPILSSAIFVHPVEATRPLVEKVEDVHTKEDQKSVIFAGKVNGGPCRVIVDTDSDVLLVNPRFVDRDSERVRLGARLRYLTGEVFPAVEKVKAKVELGQFSEELFLVVAEISDDCILGRDFLSKAG
ncbi:hypothetical protein M0804_013519 [Polistes exclamans]|nr:hypothetical protein M0804_013519 [Polistes exclamans]